jgi:hypothetical protein
MSKAWFPKKWAMTQHNKGKKASPYEEIEAKKGSTPLAKKP